MKHQSFYALQQDRSIPFNMKGKQGGHCGEPDCFNKAIIKKPDSQIFICNHCYTKLPKEVKNHES